MKKACAVSKPQPIVILHFSQDLKSFSVTLTCKDKDLEEELRGRVKEIIGVSDYE